MRKHFNITGVCYPEEHYMVNIEERLEEIKGMVDRGEYFVVNRARQYGKTTTIHLLAEKLAEDYAVFSISFEGMEDEAYSSAAIFCERFCRLLYRYLTYHKVSGIPEAFKSFLGILRRKYLTRKAEPTFQSVILAGVCCHRLLWTAICVRVENMAWGGYNRRRRSESKRFGWGRSC